MIEPTYFSLADVEDALSIGRDTLCRCAAAGLLRFDGENKQRRVVASSYYALKRRIDEGATLWQLLNDAEQKPSEAKPTEKDQSIEIVTAVGGSSRRRKTKEESPENTTPPKTPPNWLRRIT